MVVGEEAISNIMGGIENTGGVKQHNHKKKLRQRFDIIKKLGQGTFGKVQLGINKETGQEVAIKTIKKSKIESEADLIRIRREIQIMSSVQHPNIIHIYEVFENREKMVLVMEYASGGELYDYLSERKVLPEEEARRIFRQIATACYYCHKHKICHRDLKLENILLDENNNAKIADFGLSNVFDDQRLLSTFCGSPLYASPEIVKGTPYHGPEVDCWSLGVLLYTLVYGAMPFDGSNFKRLVKQISQGDYYEPAKPSPASPLIREMLTVNPKTRANIEKICAHWWVNETYNENCLEISEDLANQTPVRLDVLLTLAPPPALESDKLVVTGDVPEEALKPESLAPTRSQSVGSLMELTTPERRIMDLINEEKATPKRKLESTVSTDRANLDKGLKRKEKIIKENTIADITIHGTIHENASQEDASMKESAPLNKSLTQTLSREMDVEQTEEIVDPSIQGAACAEILKEVAQKKEREIKPSKVKKTASTSVNNKILEGINEIPSQENVAVDKENANNIVEESKLKKEEKIEEKTAPKKKILKKKILSDKNDNQNGVTSEVEKTQESNESEAKKVLTPKSESRPVESKPVERRKSRIFEAAEKFQNMISPADTKPAPKEKPKKIVIPGVSVGGFKKEFERKASLTSESPPKLKEDIPKKVVIDESHKSEETSEDTTPQKQETSETPKKDDEHKERVKNAVNIISTALDKEGTRKSKSRPCIIRKPPVPFGASGRSASGNIGMITSPLSPPVQNLGPKPFVKPTFEKLEAKQVEDKPVPEEENKTSSAEITLKSATLPRRKMTKAQIQLNYPVPKPAQMEFKTEVAHNVQAVPKGPTQVSEVVVPVSAAPPGFRSVSSEPESSRGSKERIIPIAFEKAEGNGTESVQSPPAKPPMPRPFQTQKSNVSQRSNSLSRQSTQESDTETVGSNGEPIKKSPREYIIPIAVEGGGYVTPRAGSLEPSDTASTTSTLTSKSKLGSRHRRLGSMLSDRDSEDESPFSKLHRHSSFGKDSDTEDSRSDAFHMHRLRSTRPKKSTLEHNDSLSSGEEDDDEGFEILTAENLFSTLLSRVRDLTQRLNVDDGVRPGFPNSRLLSQFDHGMWNRIENPVTRHSSLGRSFGRPAFDNNFGVPWRRSVSRDLASDIESVFNSSAPTNSSSTSARVPRGDIPKNENLNLADLDLQKLKLSEEDALALSYLTPGLSRRIQKQLLSQLTPSEVKKLHRTLSACDPNKPALTDNRSARRSIERMTPTPKPILLTDDNLNESKTSRSTIVDKERKPKSFLPVRSNMDDYHPTYDFNIRSSSIGAEPRGEIKSFQHYKPDLIKPNYSYSKHNIQSPESSISESLTRNDSYRRDKDSSISELSSKYSDSSVSKPYSRNSSESSYNRYIPSRSFSSSQSALQNASETNKNESKKPTGTRRISRFLRPDFFDAPKEQCANIYLKEKKEREMETQKVLKEIRDKRKGRLSLRRDQSASKERHLNRDIKEDYQNSNERAIKHTDKLVNDVSENIKKLEVKDHNIHDYVNVPGENKDTLIPSSVNISTKSKIKHDYVNVKGMDSQNVPAEKKERVSKIVRPKSYPTESIEKIKSKISPEKVAKEKSSKKQSLLKQPSKDKSKEEKNEVNKNINDESKAHKNKLLHSIEKKLEKFRSNSMSSNKDSEEIKALEEKKSSIENAIKRLREQSLPKNLEQCTESGLIKRAVSVEDLYGSKPLQASKKSVSKILGLFKKYEEQDKKKTVKKSKTKEDGNSLDSKTKHMKREIEKHSESPVSNNNTENVLNCELTKEESKDEFNSDKAEKKERPSSLLLENIPNFANACDGTKSDSNVNYETKELRTKSKLPVTSYRRSLNLDHLAGPPRYYKNPTKLENGSSSAILRPSTVSMTDENVDIKENRNSLATTDDSSTILSPTDEYLSCDSWSACSDHHHINDLQSPVSHNGHGFSGDESESVIDRIRRKSFYTRFNEKKRPRKPTTTYNDLVYKPGDYGSLDRRTYDYRNPVVRRSSYASSIPESGREYRPYARSASVLNDYVNIPNSYQTYGSRISRPSTRGLYSDVEGDVLDDLPSS